MFAVFVRGLLMDGSQRNVQQREPGKLEGPDGDLADAVAAQSQDLQAGAQVVQSAQLQRADLVIVQVPEPETTVSDENWMRMKPEPEPIPTGPSPGGPPGSCVLALL